MGFFQGRKNGSAAGAGLMATLVAVVWCASCGSSSGGSLSNDDDSGTGDDATCNNFGGCPTSSSGGSSGGSSGFGSSSGGASSGSVMPSPNDVVDTNCPSGTAASIWTATGNAASIKWLYPYDQTIFPGGLAQPILQWSQTGTPTNVYVHAFSNKYDFKGCYKAATPLQVQMDTNGKEWATAYAQSAGKGDPLTVELRTSSGGAVSVAKEQWTFAKGSLAGDVYYNTYASKLVPGQAMVANGAVVKIDQGKASVVLYVAGASPVGPCVSCHSLSSNGSMLVAQRHFYPGGLQSPGSMSFDLTKSATPNPASPLASNVMDDWGLSAVYPDGTFLLTNGQPTDSNAGALGVFPKGTNDIPGMIGPKPSVMYNTSTGATIPYTGLTTSYAMMPMFSTDGKQIVYNDFPDGDAAVGGHTLTVMDFNASTKAFSNPRTIFTDPTKYPGWPFFTPDGKQVIFSLGVAPNFASEPSPPQYNAGSAQLYEVDVASKTAHRLDETSGYSGSTDYLPFPGRDENLDFFPTVNPLSAGGYFWVYFTSRRQYGNMVQNGSVPGKDDVASKSIWVSAIDINPTPGTDPSHPAFYLPGQELGSGNIRAFSVLAPCKGDGSGCESGIDCCGGSCTSGKCGAPAACADENSKCSATIPCCISGDECIGGYCGVSPPK
jgi:WD40-like Beta Propeller Repeat